MRAVENHTTARLREKEQSNVLAVSVQLEFRGRGRHFIQAKGFHPFSGDAITFGHGHTGIGVEHLRPTAATPGEKTDEMIFTDGTGAGRGIGSCLAVWHTAM